jgi:glycolate oxidase
VPLAGGIVIAFQRMASLLRLDRERRRALCQPGLVTLDLATAASALGLTYAPDPASHRVSTLGGNVAENSGGPHCASQGVTTQHIERLRVVTADGRLAWLPWTRDRADGMLDLSGLVVGSEGTLALVTRVEARLVPQAAGQDTLLGAFADMETACRAVSAIVASGLVPATLEVMDRATIEVVERFTPAGYPAAAGAVLLLEVEGEDDARGAAAAAAAETVRAAGALEVRLARDQAERDALWRGRRASYGAMARLASHLWVQDVTVPRPLLAPMIRDVEEIARRYRLPIATVAHAGDGNLHPSIPYHPEDADEYARMKAADRDILEACVARGGSITGEHGVGIDKLEALPLMYTEAELGAMWAVRRALDPEGVLNPLKAVISPAQARAAGRTPRAPDSPGPDEERVLAAVRDALAADRRPLAKGGGRRVALAAVGEAAVDIAALVAPRVEVDAENLTLTATASASTAMVAEALAHVGLALRTPTSGATLGGFVARDPYRPSRASGLSARDSLLAVTAVVGNPPAVVRFGRATTKNVAGYDMPRLWAGSAGRVGPIVAATLRLWPARPQTVFVRDGAAADLWQTADAILGASWRPAVWALAVEGGEGGARLLVRAEAAAAPMLAAAGLATSPPEADALAALEQRLEAAECASAAGRGAILYAWNLEPKDEAVLFARALALDGAWAWGMPGARIALVAPGRAPDDAVRAWAAAAMAAGGQLAVSAAAGGPWKALEPPPDPVWRDWVERIERALATGAASKEDEA